jgi:TP901 family phage tail tape measure protein
MEESGVQLIAQGGDKYIITLDKATKATDGFATATVDAMGRLHGADGRFLALGNSAETAGRRVKDSAKGFGAFGEIVTGALREVGRMATNAMADAARATAAFVTDSIGLAGDFEAGMLQFQSVAGRDVDTQGLEKFHDLFLQLGKELPVSTKDVQMAAIEMVKGGIDPATIAAGGLRQNIQFAAAAMGGDLVKAAEISSKIMGGWAGVNATAAEKADFLTHATDLLAKAANASSTDVEGLALGIFNSQGIARTAGVSFDDLTTTLAALAPRFESSSVAGNSLKNMIARLQPTTDPAAQAMASLGLYTAETGSAFYNAQGNFVGFEAAAQLLQDSLKGLTKAQQAAMLQQIFGNDAMGAAAGLAELGAQGYTNMAEALLNANGVSEAAALKQQGFNTALDNAKGSVEAMQIAVGEKLLPVLTDLLNNTIAPAINTFGDWATAILGADDPMQALIKSIDDIAPGFQSFVDNATIVAAFISDNLEPILFGLATAITVAVVPALMAATGAFLAAAAPVVALVAVGALLYKAWETDFLGIKTTVTKVWNDALLPAFKDMQAWLAEKIPPAIKTLSDFWMGTLQPALETVWSFLQSKVFPVLSDLVDIYIAAAIIEVKALATLWTGTLQPALKVVWDFISGSVIPIFKALFEVNWAIATKAVEAMAGLWQKVLQPAFAAVGDYITSTVVPAFQSVGDYLDKTFGPILKSAKDWLDKVTGGFGGVSGAVKDVTKWLGDLATSISNLKLPDWLTPGSPTPWEVALRGIGNALQTSVGPGLSTMRQGMKDIGQEITDTFEGTDIIDTLMGLGTDAMDGFANGLQKGMRAVVRDIDEIAKDIEDRFKEATQAHSPAQRFVPAGENIMLGIMQGMSSQMPALTDMIGSISADLITDMENVGRDMQDAIADGFGATASIDRQIAKNLDSFKDVLPQYEQFTTGALREAQSQAEAFLDPAEGAKFFAMRSKQILEYAKLQNDLAKAETDDDRARIEAQMLLINRAQTAEISQFEAQQASRRSATEQMADDINAIMATIAGINLTDDQIQIVGLLSSIWGTLQTPVQSRADAYANPPMMQYPGGGSSTSTSTQNINMPIYTNNTPAALQQSWAVMQASMT